MNARIAKEVRTQAPVLALVSICAVAMLAVYAIQTPYRFIETEPMLLGIYFLSSLLMAAMTFGNEFHLRTMSLLLSQPISRRKLWPEKMRVLGCACAVNAFITFAALSCTMTVDWQYRGEELFSICWLLVFVPILFCCTAPYFTLVSKSTLGGIVFTIFGGGMLLVLSGEVWNRLSVLHGLGELKDKLTHAKLDGPSFTMVILSIPYAASLYWLGRRRFLRLEVIDSQSLEANLPLGVETTLANFSARFKSPFSRLLFKELRLQRISLMLTVAFCLFMVVERFSWSATNDRSFVVAGTFLIYLFLFTVIVCTTAVAEEKTWGMKDWHLTLPPSLNKQWRVKWFVALILSLVFGAGLTWLASQSGPWRKEIGIGWEPESLCYFLLIATALYAGSISTSTIRALLVTFGILAAFTLIKGILFNLFSSLPFFENMDTATAGLFVLCTMLAQLYGLLLRLLLTLLVWPVYLVTQSQEKAQAVTHWADQFTGNIQVLFLGLYVAGFFWLLLRFARKNYRHSDLPKRAVALQLVIILFAAIFLVVAIAGAQHVWHGIPVF